MIKHIMIHSFRLFNSLEFNLGKKITVISGQNATGKSTLLGLMGATFELPTCFGTTLFKKQFRAKFSEMFTASRQHDCSISKMMTISLCNNNDWDTSIETYDSRTGWWTEPERYRIIPKRRLNGRKSEKKITYPSLYLGLSRLYPIGESEALTRTTFRTVLTDADKTYLSNLYQTILFQPEALTDVLRVNPNEAQRKYGIGTNTASYDYLCNSAGQDNLGQILFAILSFKKLKNKMGENWTGGLLLIDEFDATLHAGSQEALFEYILTQCSEIGIQIAFTTHSLYLLEHITNKTKRNEADKNNDIELVFLTTANGSLKKMVNPDFSTIMYDLNMKLQKENTEPIKIYCEDNEARYIASVILEAFLSKIKFANFNAGRTQLTDLFKCDEHFQKEILIFLDGDAQTDYDSLKRIYPGLYNVKLLPSTGVSPEKDLHQYIFTESPHANLIACFDENAGQSLRNIKSNHPLIPATSGKERDTYKSWFKKLYNEQPSLLKKIVNAWIMDHENECNEFIESFKQAFNIIAAKKSIAKI